jgi:aminopeptidase N
MILAALAAVALQTAPPAKGSPPITEQTQKSGGVRPAEQLAVRFDSADLAFEVLPDSYRLTGVATLGFTATAPLDRLVIDLDRNLPVRAIAIDGAALAPADWSNPDGQLVVRLPRAVTAGQTVSARITYGGTPHVAIRAPWDDGVVWSKTPDGRTWFATTAEGYGCDLFWPCLDFPKGEPGVVTLHITVPKGLKAPSNGRLLGVDRLPDGRTTWHWRTEHPNTYGIALNVGPYE